MGRWVTKSLVEKMKKYGQKSKRKSTMHYNKLTDLPPTYQKQAEAKIADLEVRKEAVRKSMQKRRKTRPNKGTEVPRGIPKGNKYHAKKVEIDGMTFDSQKEACRWSELKILQEAGVISGLRTQVEYELLPVQKDENGKVIEHAAKYVADFVYCDALTGCWVVEDVNGYKKGAVYNIFVLKRKMMLHKYGIRVKEI